jgi:hypothetical protein
MTGPLLIAGNTIAALSVLVALIAASRGVADWLERRRCICLYEHWPAAIGIETQDDGSQWLVYPPCKVHGHQARTPILDNKTTASGELAVR